MYMTKPGFAWGCVADDFTGASDAASFWADAGMRVLLVNGIPSFDAGQLQGYDGVVIALKTRTAATDQAVSETLKSCRWLKAAGARQLFIKYCSTFDSTPKGNIGPILDAIMEEYELPYTILCPALPINGRTVKDGILYVNNIPLSESPMKNHPLTPMWDSRLKVLIEAQSKYPALELNSAALERPAELLQETVSCFNKLHKHFYLIPDYYLDAHASKIAELFGSLPVLSGGSGLMTCLAKRCLKQQNLPAHRGSAFPDGTKGGALLLAGSCSTATLDQIEDYKEKGNPWVQIHPEEWLNGRQTVESVMKVIRSHDHENVLVYSSAPAEDVRKAQEAGSAKVATALEQAMASLAAQARKEGTTRIIVAGGETSGAVTKALGFYSYTLGNSIAPGVPVLIPMDDPSLRLVLKSGNFGQTDFFTRAVEKTGIQ